MRILFPLPQREFDPTEAAIPWKALIDAGHEVVFATPNGQPAAADPRILTGRGFGPFRPFLRATAHARQTYDAMVASDGWKHPKAFDELDPSDYNGVHLTGGHAPGMKPYLESTTIQDLIGHHMHDNKPVGAICHGVLLMARARDPESGKPVLDGRRSTALQQSQELSAWALTGLWLGSYYRTYPETVQEEVTAALGSTGQFVAGPFTVLREHPDRSDRGFTIRDGRYLSARFYGDAYRYAAEFVRIVDESAD